VIVRQTLADAPPAARAIALGTFDGVHRGHAAVIRRAVEAAAERDLRSAVVTFAPHPAAVVRPGREPPALSSPARRAALVEELGADELVIIRFDAALARRSPEEFSESVVADALGARHVVVGENFRFGRGAAGHPAELAAVGERLGFDVETVPLLAVDGEPVSSSRIRDAFAAGAVDVAARLLGRPPWVEGAVIAGDRRGRSLGYPTANVAPLPGSALPGRGIYAGRAALRGLERPAAIGVGSNPTFSDDDRRTRIEAYLLDFDADIYGSPIRLEFHHRLRDELRFDSADALARQMADDVEQTRALAAG
jgi:riboflavin kinase/FMN adenylyltransferase